MGHWNATSTVDAGPDPSYGCAPTTEMRAADMEPRRTIVERQATSTAELSGAAAPAVRPDVAIILRDSSMRILEAVLAFGALATALLLGLAR